MKHKWQMERNKGYACKTYNTKNEKWNKWQLKRKDNDNAQWGNLMHCQYHDRALPQKRSSPMASPLFISFCESIKPLDA
jgi:hypothetical protein